MTNLDKILAAVDALSDDERAILTNYLVHGVKPVEPVPVTIEKNDATGGYRVVLPDGTAIENNDDDVIFEISTDIRRNYVEPDLHGSTLRVYEDPDLYRDTTTWAMEIEDEIIPVALPEGWKVVWW